VAYRRFKISETSSAPAALAALAALHPANPQTAATAATAARLEPETHIPFARQRVASVATVARVQTDIAHWDEEDWQAAFDERAAILEYDGGFPRAEAERLAGDEISGLRAAGLLGENGALTVHVEHVEHVELSGREGDR
jgi:hypothetical protein